MERNWMSVWKERTGKRTRIRSLSDTIHHRCKIKHDHSSTHLTLLSVEEARVLRWVIQEMDSVVCVQSEPAKGRGG